jgi:hypothetical protein
MTSVRRNSGLSAVWACAACDISAARRRWTRRRCLCGHGDRRDHAVVDRHASSWRRAPAWRARGHARPTHDASSDRQRPDDAGVADGPAFALADAAWAYARRRAASATKARASSPEQPAWSDARCPRRYVALVRRAERDRRARLPCTRAVRPMRWTYCSGTSGRSKLMTWLTLSTSMPRAAISVATSRRALPLLEGFKRTLALTLALVAVDRFGGNARRFETLHDAVGAVLGAREDKRAADRLSSPRIAVQQILLARVIRRA